MDLGVEGCREFTRGTGMPHFAHRKLRRQWDLDDVAMLHRQLREVLGDDYELCLRNLDGPEQEPLVVSQRVGSSSTASSSIIWAMACFTSRPRTERPLLCGT